jgi:hypothetical protein
LALAALAAGGCGDPLLPSDYAGAPAGSVAGNVLSAGADHSRDVDNPGLSVEWLGDAAAATPVETPLIEQSVMVQRSARLDTDWDIRLQRPADSARLRSALAGPADVHFSVGKMVYFDDRVTDGVFDRSCRGSSCDVAKAISIEYVVFVEVPPTCGSGTTAHPLVRAGYHYYRFDAGNISELAPGQPMSFVVSTAPPAATEITAQLRAFADALLASWRFDTLVGC